MGIQLEVVQRSGCFLNFRKDKSKEADPIMVQVWEPNLYRIMWSYWLSTDHSPQLVTYIFIVILDGHLIWFNSPSTGQSSLYIREQESVQTILRVENRKIDVVGQVWLSYSRRRLCQMWSFDGCSRWRVRICM